MQIEDYFDMVSVDEIRIRGTRVGIEAVLFEYLEGAQPEEIARDFPVTLEQVHATITYYLHDRKRIDEYLSRWTTRGEHALQRQRQAGNPLLDKLLQARRLAAN